MNEEQLISLVSQYRELYDLQHPHYDDNQRRNTIWKEIGGIMKHKAQECKYKWGRIRDNFRRAKKLRKAKSGQTAKHFRTPKNEKALSFLIPYIQPMESTEDIKIEEDDSSRSSNSIFSPVLDETPKNKNQKIISEEPKSSSTHSLFEKYIERKHNSQNETDRIVIFFSNLGETVKTFPEHIQIRVKRDVFKIVSEAEEEVDLLKNSSVQIANLIPTPFSQQTMIKTERTSSTSNSPTPDHF